MPPKIKSINKLMSGIYDPASDNLTCVLLARKHYKRLELEECLACLKVDADKLRHINWNLYEFVMDNMQ